MKHPVSAGRSSLVPVETESFSGAQQIVCGQNCTFVIQANGTVLACGEGTYGRLGQGNSDDLHSLSIISSLQGRSVTLYYLVCELHWILLLQLVNLIFMFFDFCQGIDFQLLHY
jgi:alpha-tubulin suppressor-like RCC1 family protein